MDSVDIEKKSAILQTVELTAPVPPPVLPSRTKVAFTILFHSSSAILSTLVSKSALNAFDAPILLLALQFSVQVILLTLVGVPMGWIKPFQPLSRWQSLIPLTAARLTGVLAKTFCLAAVDAAFYQVARGLLLPFTLLLSLAILRPTPHFPSLSLFGVGAIMTGFLLGFSKDFGQHLTGVKGIVLGVGSSFTTAVESVVVKRYLTAAAKPTAVTLATAADDDDDQGTQREEEMSVWQMVWMSNVLFLVLFIPLLLLTGDMSTLIALFRPLLTTATATSTTETHTAAAAATLAATSAHFLPLAFLTGVVGFFLTIATFMQINVTSPTTHMIVTAARGVAQSALAVVVLREAITVGRVSSMVLILSGSALYGWAKDQYTYGRGAKPGYSALGG